MTANALQCTTVTRDDSSDEAATPARVKRSAAQRQREYRRRCRRAVIDAIGEEASASRVTLLALLADDLAALEARTTSDTLMHARRGSVKRILNVIVTRYGIDLSD